MVWQRCLINLIKLISLVNNAGISLHKPIKEMSVEVFNKVININLNGTFICSKSVIPYMEKQKRGKIVNIASLAGRTGRTGSGSELCCFQSRRHRFNPDPGTRTWTEWNLCQFHLSGVRY